MRIRAERGLLVRLPNWLGDFVAAEPATRACYDAFARCGASERLAFVAPQRLLELFAGRFDGARRIASDAGGGAAAWRGYETALLLTGSFRSALVALRSGARHRIGQARDGRSLLLTQAVAPARERGRAACGNARRGRFPRWLPRPVGAVASELLGELGIPLHDTVPRLEVAPKVRAEVRRRLAALGVAAEYLLVNAGGRPGSAKALPADAWSGLLEAVPEERAVVLAFGRGEEARAAAIRRKRGVLVRAFDDRAADLHELLALIDGAVRFVTTDTGPRHLARALGVPTDVLVGPTDARHTLDRAPSERVFVGRVACSPCHLERCPLVGPDELACLTAAAALARAAGSLSISAAATNDRIQR